MNQNLYESPDDEVNHILYRSKYELSDNEKEKLLRLHRAHKCIKEKDTCKIKNKKLKKRVAKYFLKLINNTVSHEKFIQNTSFIIAGFIQYNYGDDLDNVVSIAAELELPKHHVSGDIFKMFKRMKLKLNKYLS